MTSPGNSLIAMAALLLAGCAVKQPAAPACALSSSDQAWVERAMRAWDYTSREVTGIARVKKVEAVLFDARCVLTSGTAMSGGPEAWRARPHGGQVTLPDGATIPAGVISFAMDGEERGFFVMSTPSVWRAAGKEGEGLDLETLMVAVLLHEGTHVAQFRTYGARMTKLAERWRLPESFNDDSIQKRFQSNPEFSASVTREIDLLLGAAGAGDAATALRRAGEARALMRARQERWYPAAEGYLLDAEDIWLTLEGSAQWAAYQWVVDPLGGRIAPAAAVPSFGRRGKWWSQDEGFALFMALDRLTGGRWKRQAFGEGAKTVLEMVDDALAAETATGAAR